MFLWNSFRKSCLLVLSWCSINISLPILVDDASSPTVTSVKPSRSWHTSVSLDSIFSFKCSYYELSGLVRRLFPHQIIMCEGMCSSDTFLMVRNDHCLINWMCDYYLNYCNLCFCLVADTKIACLLCHFTMRSPWEI